MNKKNNKVVAEIVKTSLDSFGKPATVINVMDDPRLSFNTHEILEMIKEDEEIHNRRRRGLW